MIDIIFCQAIVSLLFTRLRANRSMNVQIAVQNGNNAIDCNGIPCYNFKIEKQKYVVTFFFVVLNWPWDWLNIWIKWFVSDRFSSSIGFKWSNILGLNSRAHNNINLNRLIASVHTILYHQPHCSELVCLFYY